MRRRWLLSGVRRTVYGRPVSDSTAPCTVRTLTEADLQATDRVLKAAYRGIESRVALIRRFLALDPESWRVAVDGTTIVGCVGAVDYGRFAYVGMMAVHPEAQSRGIGRALMRDLLDGLAKRGVTTVLLDATPAGAPLYASLAFEADDDACLYTRAGQAAAAVRPEAAIPLDERDLERIVSLDAPIFGADRGRLLALMLAAYRGRAFGVLDGRGELSGFVIAQERRIGPWMTRDAAIGDTLLAAALSVPFLDAPVVIAPGVNARARAALVRHGFAQTGGTRHMRRGPVVRRDRTAIWGQLNYSAG